MIILVFFLLYCVNIYSIVLNYDPNRVIQTTCNSINPGLISQKFIYSGYLKLKRTNYDSALAYMFYGSKNSKSLDDVAHTKTIIWLNGGPGESSMIGNFFGIGPLIFDDNNEFVTNSKTWNNKYNLLFIDQPVGTGFSIVQNTTDIPSFQKDIASDFYDAMNEFFQSQTGCIAKFPGLQAIAAQEWFIFGQGYAGNPIHFKGIALGDPFTNPLVTISEIGNFGFSRGISTYQERQQNEQAILSITYSCYYQQWNNAHQSYEGSILIDLQTQSGTKNPYNIQKSLDYDDRFRNFQIQIQRGTIKDTLGFLYYEQFTSQSEEVKEALYNDFLKSDAMEYLQNVINSKQHIHVLIFQCQNDLMIPSPGVMKWVYNLQYQYTKEFQGIDFKTWVLSNDVVGFLKRVDNLEFRVLLNSGQYAYMDQPDVTLKMIIDFIEQYY